MNTLQPKLSLKIAEFATDQLEDIKQFQQLSMTAKVYELQTSAHAALVGQH
jgi:hypothetical protein